MIFIKILCVQYEEGLSEINYLEKIYKQVRIHELVKFNGKAYMRSDPNDNIYKYHFYEYKPNIYYLTSVGKKIIDDDGELVNIKCDYRVKLERGNV